MLSLFRKRPRARAEELRRVIETFETPSFPEVAVQVLGLLRTQESTTAEIANALRFDAGLHVRVLRTVNSASYGLSSRVDNVERAIPLLGRSRLETLVLAAAVKDVLPEPAGHGYDGDRFWLVSARRGCVARSLATHLHPNTESESFVGGLLQDLAIPLLFAAKKDEYARVYERWRAEPGQDLTELEREAFGYDHTHAGELVAATWNLPEHLVQAVRDHHDWSGETGAAAAVRVAGLLHDAEDEEAVCTALIACEERLGLSPATITKPISEALGQAESVWRALK